MAGACPCLRGSLALKPQPCEALGWGEWIGLLAEGACLSWAGQWPGQRAGLAHALSPRDPSEKGLGFGTSRDLV